MTAVLVFIGGAIGAPARYLTDRYLTPVVARDRFPLGTLVVNIVGCFVLGLVTASHHLSHDTAMLLGTGFCGGLTTFSTFAVESLDLFLARRLLGTAAYLVLSVALGLGAAKVGLQLG